MAKAKGKEDKVTVLAFEKKLVPSDGFFYGTTWAKRKEGAIPLALREKSVRGTISNRLKPAQQNDEGKINAEVSNPNLQTVDYCALEEDQDTLKMTFTLKVLPGVDVPSACNNNSFQQSYTAMVQQYIETEGFRELAYRYASNLANARFLWRNRLGASQVEVEIKDTESGQTWTFANALDLSTRRFEEKSSELETLAERIAAALSGKERFLLLDITVFAEVGRAQEVYPSEELVMDKGKGKKSKILYHINGVAGMHSQKIGNAIRTIDTWYPEHDDLNVGPIAVEVYGAVTNLGKAFRQKKDFYSLFDPWARGETILDKNDAHYVMAMLVRGGVFGESGKDS